MIYTSYHNKATQRQSTRIQSLIRTHTDKKASLSESSNRRYSCISRWHERIRKKLITSP